MLTEIKEREKQSLTSAELNVIDWINENEEKIPDMSINEIADASHIASNCITSNTKVRIFWNCRNEI